MTHQKVTRDVTDFKIRPINDTDTPGIDIDGDCGANFSIDGVPIGQNAECAGKFALLEATGNLEITGTGSFGGALDMNSNQINELADGTLATDAITLGQADLRYVNVSGDTMTGFLFLNADPTSALHAATRQWVLSEISTAVANVPGGFDSGQTMQDVTGSRSHNTTYTNTTGVMMWVTVAVNISSSGQLRLLVDGIGVTESDFDTLATNDWIWHACMVPPGSTYRLQLLTGTINSQRWTEYRL